MTVPPAGQTGRHRSDAAMTTMTADRFLLYGTRAARSRARPADGRPAAAPISSTAICAPSAYDGIEVLRAISYLVRDRDWGTYEPALADLTIDQRADGFLRQLHGALRTGLAEAELAIPRDHLRRCRRTADVRRRRAVRKRFRDQPLRLLHPASDRRPRRQPGDGRARRRQRGGHDASRPDRALAALQGHARHHP